MPAQASVSILDGADAGTYYVNSEHYYECPYSPGSTFMASVTSASFYVLKYDMQLNSSTNAIRLPFTGRYLRGCFYIPCDYMGGPCQPGSYDIWRITNDPFPGCPFGITLITTVNVGMFRVSCSDKWAYRATYCGP